MIPGTKFGAESIYNLFNEKEPSVFPGTFVYSATAASNNEQDHNKTVDKKQSNINRNRPKQY